MAINIDYFNLKVWPQVTIWFIVKLVFKFLQNIKVWLHIGIFSSKHANKIILMKAISAQHLRLFKLKIIFEYINDFLSLTRKKFQWLQFCNNCLWS